MTKSIHTGVSALPSSDLFPSSTVYNTQIRSIMLNNSVRFSRCLVYGREDDVRYYRR